jgi:hypothetical protein
MLELSTAGKDLTAVLDFDPAEAPLLSIIKNAYPTDTQIQQLQPKFRPKRVSKAVEQGTAADVIAAHSGR